MRRQSCRDTDTDAARHASSPPPPRSLGYFKQRTIAGEVGSSTMPHKVCGRVAGRAGSTAAHCTATAERRRRPPCFRICGPAQLPSAALGAGEPHRF